MKLLSTLILLLASAITHAAGNVSAGLKKDASKFSKNWNSRNMTTDGHSALDNIYALADNIPGAILKEDKNSVFLFLPQRGLEPAKVVQGTMEKDGTLTLKTFRTNHVTLNQHQMARLGDDNTKVYGEYAGGEGLLVFRLEKIGDETYRIKSSEQIVGAHGRVQCSAPVNNQDGSKVIFEGEVGGGKYSFTIDESGKVLDLTTDFQGRFLTVRILKNGEVIEKKYARESMDLVGEPPHKLILKEEAPLTPQQIEELGLKFVEEVIPGLKAARSTDLPKIRKKSR